MEAEDRADIRDLASLLAQTIRRMGVAYGDPEDWRGAITALVHIATRQHRRLVEGRESLIDEEAVVEGGR